MVTIAVVRMTNHALAVNETNIQFDHIYISGIALVVAGRSNFTAGGVNATGSKLETAFPSAATNAWKERSIQSKL